MIICGTDFTAHANHAALAAAALAARLKGTLTLAHVLDPSLYHTPSPDLLEHLRNSRRDRLANLAERTIRRGARTEFCLAEGSPGESLARLIPGREVRLLVLGSAGQVDPGKWCTGSVLDHAVESATVPTLVVRDADSLESWVQNDRPMRIVVGYDFSPASEAALHWGRVSQRNRGLRGNGRVCGVLQRTPNHGGPHFSRALPFGAPLLPQARAGTSV